MEQPYRTKEQLTILLKKHNLLTPQVQKAIHQAEISHAGQLRDNGESYLFEHIYPVTYSILERYFSRQDAERFVIIALLHDAPEDDHSFTFEICEKEFGKEISESIRSMVKSYKLSDTVLTDTEKYEFYKEFMKQLSKANEIVKIVKLEERLNNMESTISINQNPEKYLRFIREVEEMFYPLAKDVSEYYYSALKQQVERLQKTAS